MLSYYLHELSSETTSKDFERQHFGDNGASPCIGDCQELVPPRREGHAGHPLLVWHEIGLDHPSLGGIIKQTMEMKQIRHANYEILSHVDRRWLVKCCNSRCIVLVR